MRSAFPPLEGKPFAKVHDDTDDHLDHHDGELDDDVGDDAVPEDLEDGECLGGVRGETDGEEDQPLR